ncbi:MAG: ATP-binding cassette domain-containing protein, partial [Oscillospiraceae bacterium]|nr:ATP-binding cassette domain-containing protein [Oscillospiraceae bacterium]
MISSIGVTVRFGKRVLFEDVNIKFTKGNCYGLIGANGAGKSTFLKVLSGEIEASKGDIAIDRGSRISTLKQDHFAYEEHTVIDTVIMGNEELYKIMKDKEAIYMKEDFSEADGIKVAKLEERFAELDGWNSESDAAILLNSLEIPTESHHKQMKELEAKDKVKV